MKAVLLKAFELIGCRRVVVTALGGNTLFKISSPDIKKHKYQLNEIGRLLMSYGLNSSVEYQDTNEGPCIIANMNGSNTVTYQYPVQEDRKPWGRQEHSGHDFSYWGAVEDIVLPGVDDPITPEVEAPEPKDLAAPLVSYVRKNLGKLKSLFLKPLGYKAVEELLQQDMNLEAGIAQLVCPIVNQRVDLTLSDATFKRALDTALVSTPVKKMLNKQADIQYLTDPTSTEGFEPAYVPADLDYNPVVAQRIAEQISFGYETLDTWNVPEAPSERQQIDYIQACLQDETKFHQRQRQALYDWVKERNEASTQS